MSIPRIAFYGFHTGPGGIGKVMLNLINAVADFPVNVDVILAHCDAADVGALSPKVRLVEIGPRGIRALVRLVQYLKVNRPSTVLSNKEWSHQSIVLARSFSGMNTRIVFRVGSNLTAQLMRRHKVKRWLRRLRIKIFYPLADQIIAISSGLAENVISVAGVSANKVIALPNPTIPANLASLAREPVAHPWLSEKRDIPIILAVGRLSRAKDFPTLLHAFALVQRTRPCRLMILGEGKCRPELQRLIHQLGITQCVDLPGFVKNPYAYMAKANLFVLSSVLEGFSNVLVEALAVGTPAVAADCEFGPREILRDGEYGSLVPVGDTQALAVAICENLESSLSPEKLQEAVKPYEVERAAVAYLSALLPD